MKTIAYVVVATLMILSLPYASTAAKDSLPLNPGTSRRSDLLGEPARSIHEILAFAAHQGQIEQLEELNVGEVPWHCRFMLGVSLALEEYYLRELTFPSDVRKLVESGYLLEGWEIEGLRLVDYSNDLEYDSWERTLIYLPQPVGETKITGVPGRACGITMLSFTEYSLLIPQDLRDVWDASGRPINTDWVRLFSEVSGLFEVLHVDNLDPRRTKCASAG